MTDFCHLHNHSEYSVGDGRCTIETYCDMALQQGVSAVAITDHGTMAGAIELYKAAKMRGLKPLIGCELYVDMGDDERPNYPNHLTVIAANIAGYRDLITAVSMSHANFYYRPRIAIETLVREKLMRNWVVLTGCRSGHFDKLLLQGGDLARDLFELLRQQAIWAGVEVMYHRSLTEEARDIIDRTLVLKRLLPYPLVLTNDCHYPTREAEEAHQNWAQKVEQNNGGYVLAFTERDLYYRTPEEMVALAEQLGIPEAAANTVRIADACNLSIPEVDKLSWSVPQVVLDPMARIRELVWSLIKDMPEAYRSRYEREMKVLGSASHIAQSYLVAHDVVGWCRRQDIPAFCRGSMAGSIVSWLLGITHDDPIEYRLMFERAVNPARPTIPDFDIDVSSERRGAVLEYILARYPGSQPICSYSHHSPRGATKIVLRGNGLSFPQANYLSKQVSEEWEEGWEKGVPEEVRAIVSTYKGSLGSAGIHPAGILLTDESRPVAQEVPTTWVASSKQMGTQYDMYSLKSMGLFKLDILGLKTLDRLAIMKHLTQVDPPSGYDDQEVLGIFAAGHLAEIFQFDGEAARSVLHDIGMHDFEDLVAANALARPGASLGINAYRGGENALSLMYPELVPVLEYSRGAMLYQEQAMETCRILASFDDAKQDDIKEATKYFRAEVFDTLEPEFMEGCRQNNIDGQLAWDIIKKFSGYAFPRAHALSYAGLAYRMAWYKRYYPQAFYAAVFDDSERRTRLILEGHQFGVQWRLPSLLGDPSLVSYETRMVGNEVVIGLSAIKGLGKAAFTAIEKILPITDYEDFHERVTARQCNIRVQDILVKAGAFGNIEDTAAAAEIYDFYPGLVDPDFVEQVCGLGKNMAGGFITSAYEYPKSNDKMTAMVYLACLAGEVKVLLNKTQWKALQKLGPWQHRAVRFTGEWDRKTLIAEHCEVFSAPMATPIAVVTLLSSPIMVDVPDNFEPVSKSSRSWKIINVRGTSGSGKTFLMRQLMETRNPEPVLDDDGKIEAYHLDGNIYILGRYTNVCGGCDTIKTQDDVCNRVRKYAALGHVVFEGLLMSRIQKRYLALSQELGGMIWAFMDTTLEQCFANIYNRNGGKPIKRENTTNMWDGVQKCYKFAKEAGEQALWLHYENAIDELNALLEE